MTRPGRAGPTRMVCEGCGLEFAERTTVGVMQAHTEIEHPQFEGTPRLVLLNPGETLEAALERLDAKPEPNRAQRRREERRARKHR